MSLLDLRAEAFIWSVRGRLQSAAPQLSQFEDASIGAALRSRWALLGATSIFLYVGAEVSIGSLMTNFLHQDDVFAISLEQAGKLLSLYWGGAMLGRFVGSALLIQHGGALIYSIAAFSSLSMNAVLFAVFRSRI